MWATKQRSEQLLNATEMGFWRKVVEISSRGGVSLVNNEGLQHTRLMRYSCECCYGKDMCKDGQGELLKLSQWNYQQI